MKRYRTELIKKPKPGDDVYFGDVDTKGIIDTVLYADPRSGFYTKDFVQTLKGSSLIETCRNIWEFAKTQIPYVLDEAGYQWIKSPGRLWQEKEGDCKSFSVFIASCLKNLKIPYGYRFVSYRKDDPTPTHVYVYVPLSPEGSGKEVILDAVWSGPFNTQKNFEHKTDYLMSKTYYLGDVTGHVPGVLKINKPVDQLTEGELDLLLMRQAVEIDAMNKSRIGASTENNRQALKLINHCIRNVDNPDLINGIGEALENDATVDEAISGAAVGLFKKRKNRIDPVTGKKRKTKAGRLLQKVAKGIKSGAKVIAKAVTFPIRTIAKGAMEIYLPKAAIFFLYLFTPADAKLPDMMARKKKKAEKFKNFVVKGLGMKENHFMQIIRNNLAKRFGKSPESFIAEKLKARVSGIGNPKAAWRQQVTISGNKKKSKNIAPIKARPNFNTTFNQRINPFPTAPLTNSVIQQYEQQQQTREQLELKKKQNIETFTNVASSLSSGDLIGAAITAITWLIGKIGSIFKGEKMEPITADDFPDIERDAANSFDWQDTSNDYSNLNTEQKDIVKEVVTNLISNNATAHKVEEEFREKLNFLSPQQEEEMKQEVQFGEESLDHSENIDLANKIKNSGNQKQNGGFCSC